MARSKKAPQVSAEDVYVRQTGRQSAEHIGYRLTRLGQHAEAESVTQSLTKRARAHVIGGIK